MACERVGNAIVCGRGQRVPLGRCQECGVAPATLLCDGPLPKGIVHRRSQVPGADKTCSLPLCRACATHVAPDQDYCRAHAAPEHRRLAL